MLRDRRRIPIDPSLLCIYMQRDETDRLLASWGAATVTGAVPMGVWCRAWTVVLALSVEVYQSGFGELPMRKAV